jgi:Icc protein
VPGTAKGPGPMAVPPGKLRTYLGIAKVSLVSLSTPLAIVDTPLVG